MIISIINVGQCYTLKHHFIFTVNMGIVGKTVLCSEFSSETPTTRKNWAEYRGTGLRVTIVSAKKQVYKTYIIKTFALQFVKARVDES